MSYFKYIRNHKWYYRLKPDDKNKALFTDYPRNTLTNKFLVCWDFAENDKKNRFYGVFPNYLDFAKFFIKLGDNVRSFYEIILGSSRQKPKFDLDVDLSNETSNSNLNPNFSSKILNDLINAIILTLEEKEIFLDLQRDVCIYSSHGANKKSYHVVINSYCHSNNIEAKAFYSEVMKKLPQYENEKWIDRAVYSKTQQFRTYGSCKVGTSRFKKLERTWTFNGETIKHISPEEPEDGDHRFLIDFEESLITARISNCKLLPSFYVEEKKEYQEGVDVEMDLAMEAIPLISSIVDCEFGDPQFPFELDRLEGPFVVLKRLRPSNCVLCKRTHHNQNPYLLITPEKSVFFHCRRAPGEKKWYLGSLKKDEEERDEVVNWTNDKIAKLREMALGTIPKKKVEKKYEPKMITESLRKMT